jgi:hypothetical protein
MKNTLRTIAFPILGLAPLFIATALRMPSDQPADSACHPLQEEAHLAKPNLFSGQTFGSATLEAEINEIAQSHPHNAEKMEWWGLAHPDGNWHAAAFHHFAHDRDAIKAWCFRIFKGMRIPEHGWACLDEAVEYFIDRVTNHAQKWDRAWWFYHDSRFGWSEQYADLARAWEAKHGTEYALLLLNLGDWAPTVEYRTGSSSIKHNDAHQFLVDTWKGMLSMGDLTTNIHPNPNRYQPPPEMSHWYLKYNDARRSFYEIIHGCGSTEEGQ